MAGADEVIYESQSLQCPCHVLGMAFAVLVVAVLLIGLVVHGIELWTAHKRREREARRPVTVPKDRG